MKYARSPKIVATSKRTCKFTVNSYKDKQMKVKIPLQYHNIISPLYYY